MIRTANLMVEYDNEKTTKTGIIKTLNERNGVISVKDKGEKL